MNEIEAISVHLPDSTLLPITKWDREHQAFLRHLPALLKTHAGKYVAVHEEQVVDSADDLLTLVPRVYQKFGYVPIFMDQVVERRIVYRMPSIHDVRSRKAT